MVEVHYDERVADHIGPKLLSEASVGWGKEETSVMSHIYSAGQVTKPPIPEGTW